MIAQETMSAEGFSSKPLSIVLKIQDSNDNKPIFNQDNYYVNIKSFNTNNQPQPIIKFDVSDRDVGVYGIEGLNCFLLGDGSERLVYKIHEVF